MKNNLNCYKDKKPEDTIKGIKKTLTKLGFTIKEKIYINPLKNVYSLRITDQNNKGTNGKGSSLIYAKASAYAEYMERLANLLLYTPNDVDFNLACYDAKKFKVNAFKNSPLLINKYKKFFKPTIEVFNANRDWCFAYPLTTVIGKHKNVYMPTPFMYYYGSNGMAAGNSHEEMAVQAISEIFERYMASKVVRDGYVPPVYSNNDIAKISPLLKGYINDINKAGCHIKIYDCTLNDTFPVYAVIIFNKEKTKMSVCFGSHPNVTYGISRCITEIFQGKDKIVFKSNVHEKLHVPKECNLDNIFGIGSGVFPGKFIESKKISHHLKLLTKTYKSNKEMYEFYLKIIKKLKWDLYYHDASYLGIHAGQYFVPGVSDIQFPTDFLFKFYKTRNDYLYLFNDFFNLKKDDQELLYELLILMDNIDLIPASLDISSKYSKESYFNYFAFISLLAVYFKDKLRYKTYLDKTYLDAYSKKEKQLGDLISKNEKSNKEKIIKLIKSVHFDCNYSHNEQPYDLYKKLYLRQKSYYKKQK